MQARQPDEPDLNEVADFIKTEKLRYQRLSIAGESTEGHDRSYLNDHVFGKDFTGLTLLDVGSYLGYFCLEALERGAAAATGIEPDAASVRQANELARFKSLRPEYICDDFERYDFSGRTFDVVICLNVLHHMYDSVHSLRRMMTLARRRLVVEFAVPTLKDVLTGKANVLALASRFSPSISLGSPHRLVDVASRTFLFSKQSMQVLFNKHTSLFEPIQVRRSPFKGRLIVVANKRHIRHLVVVAGPTSSGKSSFIRRLQADAALREKFGLEGNPWLFDDAHLAALPTGTIDRLLLHYDLLRPYRRSIRTYERDPALSILQAAERITILTIVSAQSRLQKQLAESELSGPQWRVSARHRDIHEHYSDRRFMVGWYESWMSFVARNARNATHFVAHNEGEAFVRKPPQEWANLL